MRGPRILAIALALCCLAPLTGGTPVRRICRIAVVPFTQETAGYEAVGRSLHERILAGIRQIDRYALVPTTELERVLGPLDKVRDFGAAEVRNRLRTQLQLDILIAGKIGKGKPSGYMVNFWLQLVAAPRRTEDTLATRIADPLSMADQLVDKLYRMRVMFDTLLPQYEPGADRSGPIVACILPTADSSGKRAALHSQFDNAGRTAFTGISWLRTIAPDRVEAALRRIPPAARGNAAARTILRKRFKADLLVCGTLDLTPGGRYRFQNSIIRIGDGMRRDLSTGQGTVRDLAKNAPFHQQGILNRSLIQDFVTWDSGRDAPAGDPPVLSRQVWSVLVPPIDAAESASASMAGQVREAILAALGRDPLLRVIDFRRARALFPELTSAQKLTQPMRRVLRDKLGVDFILNGLLGKNNNPWAGAWKLDYLLILGHSGKPFPMELTSGSATGFAKSIHERFTGLRQRQAQLAAARPAAWPWVRFFDEETANLRRGTGWQLPGPTEAGTLLEVPRHKFAYPYYLHCPPRYGQTGYAYPLLVFLHGVSSKSDRLVPNMFPTSPLRPLFTYQQGAPAVNRARLAALDSRIKGSFVLVPQVPKDDPNWDAARVCELILTMAKQYPVDLNRIYVMGISLGGTGSWRVGALLGKRLAALVPICGANPFAADPFSVFFRKPDLAGLPIWAFHAFDDDILEVNHTATVLDLLLPGLLFPGDRNIMLDYPHRNGNGKLPADGTVTWRWAEGRNGPWEKGALSPERGIAFTLYPSGRHDAWSATYANPAFWDWLYAQRR